MAIDFQALFNAAIPGTLAGAYTPEAGAWAIHPTSTGPTGATAPVIDDNGGMRSQLQNTICRWMCGSDLPSGSYVAPFKVTKQSGGGLVDICVGLNPLTFDCQQIRVYFGGTASILRSVSDTPSADLDTYALAMSDGDSVEGTIERILTPGVSSQVIVTLNGVGEVLNYTDTDASMLANAGSRIGIQWYETAAPSDSTGMRVDYLQVGQGVTLTPSPTTGYAGRKTTVTITASDAEWLTSPPDFSVDSGSIVSTTVLTDTTATIVYQAGNATVDVAIDDATTGASTTFHVYAPIVILEGNSQLTGDHNTLPADLIAGLTTTVDSENVASNGHPISEAITDVPTQIDPLVGPERRVCVVLMIDATNSYYLESETGAEAYADMCTWADLVHALGGNVKVVVTTTPHRDWIGGGGYDPDSTIPDLNDRIDDGNALILANGDDKFDAVVDVESILTAAFGSDPNSYTSDGLHLTQAAADTIQPAITAAIQRQLTGSGSPWSDYITNVYQAGVWADGVWSDSV